MTAVYRLVGTQPRQAMTGICCYIRYMLCLLYKTEALLARSFPIDEYKAWVAIKGTRLAIEHNCPGIRDSGAHALLEPVNYKLLWIQYTYIYMNTQSKSNAILLE